MKPMDRRKHEPAPDGAGHRPKIARSSAGEILHETARRLRIALTHDAQITTVCNDLRQLSGVTSVRVNAALKCVVVQHDGRPQTRAAVMRRMHRNDRKWTPQSSARKGLDDAAISLWTPALMAATLPVLPQAWRRVAALAVIATRVMSQPARLRSDPSAVLLDAASLAALAITGQPLVVSTSVLLRLLSERLSARLVRQADDLLHHVLPTEAARYTALREPEDNSGWAWWPLRALRPGDRVRLFAGDVIPVDGWVTGGSATLVPAVQRGEPRPVIVGEHVAAGQRLHEGTLELRAEADAASSRQERLRAHIQHAIGARDSADSRVPKLGRLLTLPLTAATLVFGLTGDSARAAAMLQADPQKGLDLALPLGREAALYALARQGLLAAGLETIERLATARALVLQDTGVLASGRWTIEAVHTESGGDIAQVRGWLAALTGLPVHALDQASFPDRVVRLWVRHGAILRAKEHDIHLASRQRVLQIWNRTITDAAPVAISESLRRELAVVVAGRVVAHVVLASALRPEVAKRLDELATLGFEHIAVFVEASGDGDESPAPSPVDRLHRVAAIADHFDLRADWLEDAMQDGSPLVMVHTTLRDLVPPGSLSLSPTDADIGTHGVLLGDPLQSLVAARQVAQRVHHRLRLQQGTAAFANAVLMTAAGLRWLPPMATTLLHHGHALLLLMDNLSIESLDATRRPASRRAAKS